MFDLITIGRSNMDLFSSDIGAEFVDITGFLPQVGGSPTNIAIGTSKLGMKTAALTAVGNDNVGDFIITYLERVGVDVSLIKRKPGLSSLAVLGVQPPDKFPLLFYRENPPDIWLDIDDLPDFSQTKSFLVSGTALARGTCADATFFGAEAAQLAGKLVWMDIDLRPDQWSHPMACGTALRRMMPLVDVVFGTEEEFWAVINTDPTKWHGNEPVTADERTQIEAWIRETYLADGSPDTIVLKRGSKGVTIFDRHDGELDVPGFPVEVLNTVGAGDAFASGLIYARMQGESWFDSGRFANGCGAIVVTKHGCGDALPTLEEVETFINEYVG
jgi:5-dehydro-2-deoxygluconokinase